MAPTGNADGGALTGEEPSGGHSLRGNGCVVRMESPDDESAIA
jgi:hypothetical protein